jgi:hypothetical protein
VGGITPGARARLGAVWTRVAPWATAAVLGVALLISLGRTPAGRTGIVEGFYLDPPHGAEDRTTIQVGTSARAFELVVPINLEAGSYPLSLRIESAGGELILARDDVRSAYRDRFLLVLCDRADFPDGDYVLRVGRVGSGESGFRFRVASRPASPAASPAD